ncbi:MAG: hypothetical protein HN617_06040 [Planctomycetaceae bacterium]|nr:hypothetical protein [Planctomycetaceae bacterium]MBT4845549.1 hypothetical protein [Planctomycetaceae bacterium]MBT5125758.1 hypothetical protein [Planctomycetaceae bacterium]MBT5598398.1 hypothetical protein [Planctomycetaceae bacterium]MBT5883511.1 hypothetical protein [Planctomycetaceae bacterium]
MKYLLTVILLLLSTEWGQCQKPTSQLLHTLNGHTGWVTTVAYSPTGKRIVSCSTDKTLKIWDANTGKLL